MSSSAKKRRASAASPDEGEAPAAPKAAKKSKKDGAAGADGKDDDGNPFWELSNKRRVGVSQFKNMCLINVREYYEKDGKMLPGKKGISLSLEQYAALLKAVPAINATLRAMGQQVDGPDAAAELAAIKPGKDKPKPAKANIEATSDEDEG